MVDAEKPTIGVWLGWLVVAAVAYAFIPDRLKTVYLLVAIAGGLVYTERKYGKGETIAFFGRLAGNNR